MQLKVSDLEIEILRKLINGGSPFPSQQRVRLELAGMIREGRQGIAVTLTGRSLARERHVIAVLFDLMQPATARRRLIN
jgi:hypothetical protein